MSASDSQAPLPASTDPFTAILLALTRIEGNLAGALDTLKRHDSALAALQTGHADHGNRLVALETRATAEDATSQRSMSGRSILWGAIASIASVAAVVIAVLLAVHGG